MVRSLSASVALLIALAPVAAQNPREKKVRDDRVKVEADGFWIYNDYPKAVAEAKKSGKPLVVALRCIPCEECVKLDDSLVDTDPVLRPLLEKFVRVRVVSTNGLDLSLFQFDTDQSFAVFLLNADGTVYGRFGTRSHRTNWVGDVSVAGLAKALEGALELHAGYPKNKDVLAAKRGPAPEFPTPEQYPAIKKTGKYTSTLATTGNIVQSCIHCHQIGDARKDLYRTKGPMPEDVLFPYPHPKSIGLTLDPKERATIEKVTADTPAAKAGFEAGDAIVSLNGQPLLSMADVQWVLHHTPAAGGTLKADVRRAGKPVEVTLTLAAGWRRADNISWRSSSWGLRRTALGGLLLEDAEGDAKGLKVKHVGQYGPHATAKNAGFQVGDVIVSYDGKTDLKRETDVLAYGVTARKPGDRVPVTVVRGGKKVELTLPLPE
ncbi:MAG TPA: Trx7/PDZ domain-containing (seleno)protein [Gemmataceae bacterium]|nr:Trx7/PDZ domain-containing (seleno)protein [Gemmataceae bacterium]